MRLYHCDFFWLKSTVKKKKKKKVGFNYSYYSTLEINKDSFFNAFAGLLWTSNTATVSDTGTDNNVIKRDKIFIKLQQTVMRQVGLICVKEEGRPLDKGHTAYTAFIIYSFLLTTLFTCIWRHLDYYTILRYWVKLDIYLK